MSLLVATLSFCLLGHGVISKEWRSGSEPLFANDWRRTAQDAGILSSLSYIEKEKKRIVSIGRLADINFALVIITLIIVIRWPL